MRRAARAVREGRVLTAHPRGSKQSAYSASYHWHTNGRDGRWRARLRTKSLPAIVLAILGTVATPAFGQESEGRCFVLCAPHVKIEPTLTFEPIFRRPSIEVLEDGEVVGTGQPETETVFELILAVGIPTQIPRVGFTIETIFIPSGDASANPFTGATADELGRPSLRGNEIEVELELNLGVLEPEQTGGWVESHFDVVDKISAAERPSDTSAYTHKLNFEWDTAFLAFKWLPESNWLHHIELEGSLDYVATGLPRRGDVIGGRERFLEDDSPWSFSLVVVFPLAPLVP